MPILTSFVYPDSRSEILSNKISLFAGDTNLFCLDVTSAEQVLEMMNDFRDQVLLISAQCRENKSIMAMEMVR